jgi:hypothetical protein
MHCYWLYFAAKNRVLSTDEKIFKEKEQKTQKVL